MGYRKEVYLVALSQRADLMICTELIAFLERKGEPRQNNKDFHGILYVNC